MPKLPKFKDDQEAAAWFESHDTSAYMDEMEQVVERMAVVRTQFAVKPVDVRMRTDFLEAIQTVAERQGIPYQALVQRWLMEKLSQEAPDLVTS
jgi:predicted DNA binding CopG/RHH family protein